MKMNPEDELGLIPEASLLALKGTYWTGMKNFARDKSQTLGGCSFFKVGVKALAT